MDLRQDSGEVGPIRKCNKCDCILTLENAVIVHTHKTYWRNVCKKCRSKSVAIYQKENKETRKIYVNDYLRRKGISERLPCQYCKKLCDKKNGKYFCTTECRFLSYVDVTEECWLWMGTRLRDGYGQFMSRTLGNMRAHRMSYLIFKGKIPNGMLVCHSCDNPSCVKPGHLWLGTVKDNTDDMIKKGRNPRGVLSHLSKLNEQDVKDIRIKHKEGLSYAEIGRLFKVNECTISSIVLHKTWKHIE